MANNSSWLEAYEAQKAKALQRLKDNKNGGGNNLSGLSEISGCVDSKEVSKFSKKTQVTKLLTNMKKPDPIKKKREAPQPPPLFPEPSKKAKMSPNNTFPVSYTHLTLPTTPYV